MSHALTCLTNHPHDEPTGWSVDVAPPKPGTAPRTTARAPGGRFASGITSLPEVRWALLATVLFAAGLLLRLAGVPSWLTGVVFAGCYLAGGWEPAAAGWRALRERTLDVDLLMIVAAVGAAAIGQVVDGGLLIVISPPPAHRRRTRPSGPLTASTPC